MNHLSSLFQNNKAWVEATNKRDPHFFERLEEQQAPKYLWIGCADSRVPANEIVGLLPGELFVHRNVANVVVHTDLNCLSVLQYAVEVLKVEHIIVCGHYGCGGVRAAAENAKLGLIDNWLRHIQDIANKHRPFPQYDSSDPDTLCELNVIEQARNVCETTVVQDAWLRNQALTVHGLIYALHDGYLRDLGFHVRRQSELDGIYKQSLKKVTEVSR